MRKLFGIATVLSLWIIQIPHPASAECGLRMEPDQTQLLAGPEFQYFAIRHESNFNDGPGYAHYRGSLTVFSRSGENLGHIDLWYDDEAAERPAKTEIKVTCGNLKEIPAKDYRKLGAYCKNPFNKNHQKSDTKSIQYVFNQISSILQLSAHKSASCQRSFQLKTAPATNVENGTEESVPKWGSLQILLWDAELKTKLSLRRYRLQPDVGLDLSIFTCVPVKSGEVVLVNQYAYSHCGGEGESTFHSIVIRDEQIKAAQKNVSGLRILKKKGRAEALKILEEASILDSENELVHYNLASAIATSKPQSSEIESHLKAYLDITIRHAQFFAQNLHFEAGGGDYNSKITVLKAELKNKILSDPDFQKTDKKLVGRLFSK